ncbi:MAG: hypothetical protein KatS3mg034_0985 [Vicingaceae bacterium]|nr:MAG: hypothetical protein KatS3mg034_0985 [Vicingaceae bacterium]
MTPVKIEKEIVVKVSPKLLYNFISTPGGLSKWFAEDVNINGDEYSFYWDDECEKARLIDKKRDSFVKFQWEKYTGTEYFFELIITQDDLTKESSLRFIDYVMPDEEDELGRIIDTQLQKLKSLLGL